MVQSQAEFPVSHHPKPGPDRFQVRSFQVSFFFGVKRFCHFDATLSSQFALAARSQLPTPNQHIFLIGEMKNEKFENN
jgi:hypothetical protein